MRKTKIICTLGPATDDPAILEALIENGMNVARFNFSHGSHAEHKVRLENLKAARTKLGIPVGALLDTDAFRAITSGRYDLDTVREVNGIPIAALRWLLDEIMSPGDIKDGQLCAG